MKETQKLLPPFGQSVQSTRVLIFLLLALLPAWGNAPSANAQPTHSSACPAQSSTTTDAVADEELKVDDGTVELVENLRILAMIVNRLTPARYPAKLKIIRIYFQNTSPAPSGEKIRLIAFARPLNFSEPPHNPTILVNEEVTIPALTSPGQFVDFPLQDGPTISSGDFFVGFQAPYPYTTFAPLVIADLNNPASQERSYRSTGGVNFSYDLQFYQTPFSPLIRAVVGASQSTPVTTVSAASYDEELASGTIAAAFGVNLASSMAAAASLPLPTELAGTIVKVKDSAGTERDAPLFFVSSGQINYLIPSGTSTGAAVVTVTTNGAAVASGTVQIAAIAPALFAANGTGQGIAAAVLLRIKADGASSYEPVAQFDAARQRFVAVPIDFGPESEQLILVLFGTGFSGSHQLPGMIALTSGANAQVLYAGAQGHFAGLDQINILLPRSLAGRGETSVLLAVSGKFTNAVTINIR